MDGTNLTLATTTGLVVTASQTKTQSFVAGSMLTTAGTQYGVHFPNIELPVGAKFDVYWQNLQAADNLSVLTYTYKEASL